MTKISKINLNRFFYGALLIVAILAVGFFIVSTYIDQPHTKHEGKSAKKVGKPDVVLPPVKVIKHLKTPESVKAIYMSACVAATPHFRAKLVDLVNETELNAIIIDIKDYSGTISFKIPDSEFADNAAGGCQVADMAEFIESLHDQNIYVIGRITAFQDPYMVKVHPDWAVKQNSDRTVNWKDRNGIGFIDPGNENMWKYLVSLGKASYAIGFDEINYDYIRFPSDGDMKNVYFPASHEILVNNVPRPAIDANTPAVKSGKSIIMKRFYEYLHANFKNTGIIISADLFGMTTTNSDDLNISQILEDAAPNFDYIAPMVYPSHYPPGFLGYHSVAMINAHPYEIVNYSMSIAAKRLESMGISPLKLRPWLQDNDYPIHYTPEMVRAQIKATYDAGLTSWMLWDAGNTYTKAALNSADTKIVLNNDKP